MSKLHNDSDLLRIELMKKFRNGTLSAEEEAHLEALKANDPFIANALEGTAVLKDGDHFAQGVDELQARIQERTKAAKSRKLYWLPIAASVALLIGSFYAVYTVLLPADTPSLSSQETVPTTNAPEESAKMESELSQISLLPPEGLADSQLVQDEELPQTLALVEPSETSANLSDAFVEDSFYTSSAQPTEVDELSQTLLEVESEAFDENFSLSQSARSNQAESEAPSHETRSFRKLTSAAPQFRQEGWKTISGIVIDGESKDPLPGVNVLVKDTVIGTVTDVDGHFTLSVPEESQKLQISIIGFVTSEVNINTGDTNLIALEKDAQELSEVVVVGYGTQEKRDLTGSVSTVDMEDEENDFSGASPLDGMRAFRKYLEEHQQYPENWQPGDKAVVKLSFYVQPGGHISNIRIEKSGGDWLDREAIRLLEEGPDWEPATSNGEAIGQEVKLRIKFKK